jgi:DNA polymerase
MRIDLASPIDVHGFRAQANSLLAHQVEPADIEWHADDMHLTAESIRGSASRPPSLASALHSIVPRSFVRITELVVLHRDAVRFDLLYRLLWRLVHEPELATTPGDADMAQAQGMAHAVRRDIFRTKRALQWRPVGDFNGAPLCLAWCEPRHHVTEEVGQAVSKTQDAPQWLLASPDRSVLFVGGQLLCGPGVSAAIGRKADDAYWIALAASLAAEPEMLPG